MSVTSTNNRKDYVGNGTQTVFAYDFLVLVSTDMEVYVDGVLKTITTDYTISGIGTPSGGNVTFVTAPASGKAVLLLRVVPATQPTDYQDASKFPAQSHEDQLDRTVMMIQQQDEEIGRALKLKKSSTQKDKDVDDLVASKFLQVKSDGSGVQMSSGTSAPAGALPLPLAVADGGTGATGAAGARDNLLADEDARTNTVKVIATQKATTTGAPAAGIGVGEKFQAESADEVPSDFGQFNFVATDIGAGSEDTDLVVLLRAAGAALAEKFRVASDGTLTAQGNLIALGAGRHAIGGDTSTPDSLARQLQLKGTFNGVVAAEIWPTLNVNAGVDGTLLAVEGTLVEAASGNHAHLSAIGIAPVFTPGAATTTICTGIYIASFVAPGGATKAAGLYIADPPTGATENWAILLDNSGSMLLRGGVIKFDNGSFAQFVETTDPGQIANVAALYARDNGAGKTQLVVRFGTGGGIVLATEA